MRVFTSSHWAGEFISSCLLATVANVEVVLLGLNQRVDIGEL